MTILALALGSPVGYAYRTSNGAVQSGAQSFRLPTEDGPPAQRLGEWLSRKAYASGCRRAVYISSAGCEEQERALAGYFRGTLVRHDSIQPDAVRRFIAGDPEADDKAVVDRVLAAGHSPGTTAEAEAIATLLYAEANAEQLVPVPLETVNA